MQILKSRPCHVPFSWTGAKDPLLGSGDESDPHVSTPTFRLVSENLCFRDLDWPSSQSKAASVSGQAEMGPKMLDFGGLLICNCLEWHRNKVQTVLRGPRAWEAALVEGRWCKF